jgi:hypothetical protein
MSIFDYGAPAVGLNDVKIAPLNADGTYGDEVDVPSVSLLGVDVQTVSAQLEGDDKITDTFANVIGAQVRVRFGSIDLEVLEVLTSASVEESGDTPNRYKKLDIGEDKMQYFGLCGKINSSRDSGDTHLWVPKIKVMEGFSLGFEYGTYSIPELTCMAVADDNDTLIKPIRHETAEAITIPPTY